MSGLILSTRLRQLPKTLSMIAAVAKRRHKQRVIRRFEEGAYPLREIPVCLCGSSTFDSIASSDRDGIPIGVKLCKQCGLGVQSPRIADESLDSFYQRDYRRLLGIRRVGDEDFERGRRRGQKIIDYLARHDLFIEGKTVMEVGCGSGGILHRLKEEGNEALGCELDRRCVAYGNSRGVRVLEGESDVLLRSGVKADLLILSHLVEHLPNPVEFSAQLHRLLSEDAVVYIEVPGTKNPTDDFFSQVQVAHLYYFDLATLAMVMATGGFSLRAGDETVRALFDLSGTGIEAPDVVGNFGKNLSFVDPSRGVTPPAT